MWTPFITWIPCVYNDVEVAFGDGSWITELKGMTSLHGLMKQSQEASCYFKMKSIHAWNIT
jgi:hypothetical protein